MIDRSDPYWYRDAIIYQLHIKSFFDANNDGIGDFEGAIQKLDYIKDLGVTAIWLLPFYPSPLRDDGYDIADYRGINPAYGTMRDFRRFVREAHERELRVITELVINHTSDQHPWFQRARRARPGSAWRDFYVWSDTDRKYRDARIIFLDTEPSNWSWDPVAKAYYWHRFFSHQPDLNFDNPRVVEAVIDIMRFWLRTGVDGLRLDAIPYLIEREGTNCENLPETHAVLKRIRAALDAEFPGRMLLAEANQWPEDTAPYFGEGDECHMAFHFPLMPRMYMGVAQEDRHPITDIMRQTPEIPEGAQWAIFLRNHDELTLEMVTDQERDYLWSFYASDRQARINLGIRRRLAPLLGNDRRKIELLNSLLLSMPGTPVIYYGDEIGMGDNIYLGDRDGVRTPMQWSPDRNGGFSRADPARLFLPPIQDPIYGFTAVNVEAQYRSLPSLLHWLRTLLSVRRTSQAFGRGSLRFLFPANRRVLAYLRELDDERILCVANLSRAPQAVELELSEFVGYAPCEMTTGEQFPPFGELPYLLTLPAHSFFWFKIVTVPAEEARFGPRPMHELFTLVMRGAAASLFDGRECSAFETNIAPSFLAGQRWFASVGGRPHVSLDDMAILQDGTGREAFPLALLSTSGRGQPPKRYFAPLSIEDHEAEPLMPYALARVRRGARVGLLVDATATAEFPAAMLAAIERGERIPARKGEMRFTPMPQLAEFLARLPPEDQLTPRRFGLEQSNTSIALDEKLVMKFYRQLQPGIHPELEVGRFLTEVGYRNTPGLLGTLEYVEQDGTPTALAVLQLFVANQGDAWSWSLEALKRDLEHVALNKPLNGHPEAIAAGISARDLRGYLDLLGRRTAELHLALATPTEDPAFRTAPLAAEDVAAVAGDALALAGRAFSALQELRSQAPERAREAIADLLARRGQAEALLQRSARIRPAGLCMRVHGDFHLGQVLISENDVVIVDFEGEPARPADERRAKTSPLRDVAGMLRSFAYLADTAAEEVRQRFPDADRRIADVAEHKRRLTQDVFLEAYAAAAAGHPLWIAEEERRLGLLRLFLLAKAFYEICYEAAHRPAWIGTPVRGVLDLLRQGVGT